MTILVCPDSFKGTLAANDAAQAMARGIQTAGASVNSILLPLADGGEGTLDVLLANGGERRRLAVEGPSGDRVEAEWGLLADGTAVVEMAQGSGLRYVRPETNDLRAATSHGTGRLLREAIHAGCRRIIVGLGGSATNDGGMGAMRALGARFLDAEGRELERGGGSLARLARIDMSGFPDLSEVDVEVATDVDNPLCGPDGATYTYGPQKGGTPAVLDELEAGMRQYARVLKETFDWDVADAPGAGAAGGAAAAMMAFLQGQFRSGIDVVMDAVGFDDALDEADVVLTGEGRIDSQSRDGKVISGVLRRAGDKPVYALCGRLDMDPAAWRAWGLHGAWSLTDCPETAGIAMEQPAAALERLAALVLPNIESGA